MILNSSIPLLVKDFNDLSPGYEVVRGGIIVFESESSLQNFVMEKCSLCANILLQGKLIFFALICVLIFILLIFCILWKKKREGKLKSPEFKIEENAESRKD
ncbi:hypothetical protein KY314_03470 [Candidatus Woesearchaeota archaeon]|nr:hypothetical protein [Candidatus Woesearchaeota archaeon]